jgi:5-methylcytosine-specific restriction endonuclease McrA
MQPKRKRLCNWPGCGSVTTGRHCERHATQAERDRKQKQRMHDNSRPGARERGYTRDWEKERATYLRDHPSCYKCGAPATVVDHVEPHKGDKRKFWDKRNWQPLCAACHSSKTATQDGGGWQGHTP